MPKMRIASRAQHFGAAHEEAAVVLLGDVLLADRRIERRPSCPGIELGISVEELEPAAPAPVRAGALRIPVGTGECALGAMLARDVVLLLRELRLPFGRRLS